jgi:hypothetical protein
MTEDPASLCSLLSRKVSQSTNIRLGNELEAIFNHYIVETCGISDLRTRVKKGEHQTDFLAKTNPSTIVYGEFKSNINLDTEKRKATREKVTHVSEQLRERNPDCSVLSYLVSLRYLKKADIPPTLVTSYHDVNLVGIADFFGDVLKHPVSELSSYENYSEFLMTIVDRLEP